MAVDYKLLLIKYIAHVEEMEGINFVSDISVNVGFIAFTKEEKDEMLELEKQADLLSGIRLDLLEDSRDKNRE